MTTPPIDADRLDDAQDPTSSWSRRMHEIELRQPEPTTLICECGAITEPRIVGGRVACCECGRWWTLKEAAQMEENWESSQEGPMEPDAWEGGFAANH